MFKISSSVWRLCRESQKAKDALSKLSDEAQANMIEMERQRGEVNEMSDRFLGHSWSLSIVRMVR